MTSVNFYDSEGFKLFPCNIDKSPRVDSWRSSHAHLSPAQAVRAMETGGYVGAWLPKDYVVIDIDRNHKAKDGTPKPDGMDTWKAIPGAEDIDTLTVKTGSGGLHLYFKLPPDVDYKTLSQKSIAESVDVRTHLGYVIAAGTNGYSVINDITPATLPPILLSLIQKRTTERAKEYKPAKQLSLNMLEKVLSKIDIEHFNTNDSWQEFITSCIAVAGNSTDVIDALETWSRKDTNYVDDTSVRKRIETFEPDGGITVGTFLYILKNEQVSKYLIDKIRLEVGAQFNFSEGFSQSFDIPFTVDYSLIREYTDLIKAFYYSKHQQSGVELFALLTKENLLYATEEKRFYYYDGNRWIEAQGIMNIIFSVLLQAGMRYYTDHSRLKDGDADDYIQSYINFLGSLNILQKFELALKQHPALTYKQVPWDSPELEGTLTLEDCVMDFSKSEAITFRKGKKEEYRRLYMNLKQKDFTDPQSPKAFKQFLKDVFPDKETRRTATYALSTMLSGTGKFRRFQIWNGAGSNGKSTLMELMKYIIGSRAISYKPEILLNKNTVQSLTPELAVFRGALAAFASETEESKRVSQGAVKSLTGNETITANPKYQGMIEFKTTFQLVLATNYLPTFSAHDNAFIERVLILPFYTCFYNGEEQKKRAEAKGSKYFIEARDAMEVEQEIKAERADILYYLASRYQEIADKDIPASAESLEARRRYVDDNDDITKFLKEMCEFNADMTYFTPTKDLVQLYNEENYTKYSAKFVIMRLKEVFPLAQNSSRVINGKLTRGIAGIRLRMGAYPDGWLGNYTQEEIEDFHKQEAGF
jgi:P4 family phage/plasmid primase-like protien